TAPSARWTNRCARAGRQKSTTPARSAAPPRNRSRKPSTRGFSATLARARLRLALRLPGRARVQGRRKSLVMRDKKQNGQDQRKDRPRANHLCVRQPGKVGQRGDGAEVQRTQSHFGKLKVRTGLDVRLAHRADEFLRPRSRAEELVLPFARHVGQQQRQPSAG